MDIGDIRKNAKILIDGTPFDVIDVDFVKPGKGRAIYRLKMRNLTDGTAIDRTFHSGDRVDEAHVTVLDMQYLYKESDHYVFMNTETFEQQFLPESLVGDRAGFMKEGTIVTITMLGDKTLGITLPTFVELEVKEVSLGSKSDTITAQNKAAVLETGVTIGVPTFIKEGDVLKVDTRTGGTYVERVAGKK
ncbi:MAG: elongation factor P [Chloroflexi bacterium]|nr:elongation factor P [Chloroflexota bacterium]